MAAAFLDPSVKCHGLYVLALHWAQTANGIFRLERSSFETDLRASNMKVNRRSVACSHLSFSIVYTRIGKFNELDSCMATSRAGFSWPRRVLSIQYMTNCPFEFNFPFFKTLTLSSSKGCFGSNVCLTISYKDFSLLVANDAMVVSGQVWHQERRESWQAGWMGGEASWACD